MKPDSRQKSIIVSGLTEDLGRFTPALPPALRSTFLLVGSLFRWVSPTEARWLPQPQRAPDREVREALLRKTWVLCSLAVVKPGPISGSMYNMAREVAFADRLRTVSVIYVWR